jgi:hypothetical protein
MATSEERIGRIEGVLEQMNERLAASEPGWAPLKQG